ncbi:ABC-type oligopeptide transport system, periplasmic component [Raoultella planticola]|uniref:ABC-type oligopeptide transport system, periplasmic component n=1 Tax=Raoultella planticola TaxID=575 RepID=A0A485CVK6_RAOPL|nr:ABC-type oligopeptide transport system, periplasmic component [Raoultella planticola]
MAPGWSLSAPCSVISTNSATRAKYYRLRPFVVKDEKPGRELTLVARKDYQWGPKNLAQQGPANLDGITFIVTPEDSVRIGALLAGQADFIRQVQAYDEKQATDQGFRIYAAPTRGVNDSLSFRPDNPLVSDLRVRQALLHATNAKQVVDTLFSANYPQATSAIASTGGRLRQSERQADLRSSPGQAVAR